MDKELLITGPSSIVGLIKDRLNQEGYSVYVATDPESLNLHDFSRTTVIIDLYNMLPSGNNLDSLTHNTQTVKKLLDIAAENNSRYLFFYHWKLEKDNNPLALAKSLIEQYAQQSKLDYSLIETADIYGEDPNTSNMLDSLVKEIIKTQRILIQNDEQNINLLNEQDFISALTSLIEDVGTHATKYRVGPFEKVKLIEFAHFAKEVTDLPISIEYTSNGSQPGRDLDALDTTPTPPGWEPQISLEQGLKEIFQRNGIPVPEDSYKEKKEEDLKLIQEQMALRDETLEPILPPELVEPVTLTTTVDTNSSSQSFPEFTQAPRPVPTPKPKKKQRISAKAKVTSLAVVLLLLTFIPSGIYSTNLYNSITNLKKASAALNARDFSVAKEKARLANTSSQKLNTFPWPITLAYKAFGYSTEDATTTINNLSHLANLTSNLAQLSESYENGTLLAQANANVLGVNTFQGESANLTKAIATIDILNKDALTGNVLGSTIESLIEQSTKTTTTLKKLKNIEQEIQVLLGYTAPQKYLVLIQNSHELRATGGTIESLALLEIDGGKLAITEFSNSSVTNEQLELNETGAIPPLPIREIFKQNELYIKDAGWNPDFATSAELIAKLYTAATANEVDGVIAMDLQTLKRLLNVYGAIEVSAYNTHVTPINLENTINKNFTKDTLIQNSFLTELSSKIFEKVTSSDTLELPLLEVIYKSLENKSVLIFHKNDSVQTALVKNDWAGTILSSENDFLYVIDSNMGSKIANSFIVREIEYLGFKPQEDMGYLRKIRITYKHTGTPNPQVYQDYLNHLRIIVPQNTFLNSAKLIKDGEEQVITRNVKVSPYGKKALYSTDLLVETGEQIVVEIEYESPKKTYDDGTIDIKIQKQPGTQADKLKVSFTYPFGLPQGIETSKGYTEGNVLIFDTDLQTTRTFEIPL